MFTKPSHYFDQHPLYDGSGLDLFAFGIMGLFIVLSVSFLSVRKDKDTSLYSPKLAWMRAGLYFCACFILSWATGVLKTLVNAPFVTQAHLSDPGWIAMTVLCFIVVGFAYLYWWPQGTVTHGRKLYFIPTLAFGILWGLSEAQLFLSVYALAEKFGVARWINALIAYFVIGAFNGAYHALWWDIHISPPHNIREWNSKKVLFGHTPNLIITLIYFTLYGSAGIYVLLQTIGLTASTLVMRFPPWFETGGQRVDKDTGLGVTLEEAKAKGLM